MEEYTLDMHDIVDEVVSKAVTKVSELLIENGTFNDDAIEDICEVFKEGILRENGIYVDEVNIEF